MANFLAHSMGSARNCARCGKELTDAASQEVGVGPVCRDLDNALLATLIPANVPAAQGAFKAGVTLTGVAPACVPTLVKVEAAVLAAATADWRETVKRIEWTLSHAMPVATRNALLATVQSLGYVGLVSLWKGEAATGKAVVSFLDGRLWLQGPRNAAGKDAIKAIPGRKFHAEGSVPALSPKALWSVPASSAAAFKLCVLSHWPNHTGLDQALAAADLAVQFGGPDKPEVTQVLVATKHGVEVSPVISIGEPTTLTTTQLVTAVNAKCRVEIKGMKICVKTPYSPTFIAALKTLPYTHRVWDAINKLWVVDAQHKDWVVKAIEQHYPTEKVVVVEA